MRQFIPHQLVTRKRQRSGASLEAESDMAGRSRRRSQTGRGGTAGRVSTPQQMLREWVVAVAISTFLQLSLSDSGGAGLRGPEFLAWQCKAAADGANVHSFQRSGTLDAALVHV